MLFFVHQTSGSPTALLLPWFPNPPREVKIAGREVFPISLLLNFLKASPSLQEIHITVLASLFYKEVPLDATLVLSNVITFSLLSQVTAWVTTYQPTCLSLCDDCEV